MKAVAYLRVSRQTQETDRQEANLLTYAKDKNIEVMQIFKEKITGISIAKERPEFSKMLQYIDENQIKLILTTEISRLGRDKRDIINICEDFIKDKIQVIFKDNNELHLLNNKGERDWLAGLVIDILSSFAQIERETAISRNKNGMQYSISIGGSGYGGIKPYGFMKIEQQTGNKIVKKLIIDEDEANVVRTIFTKYLQGLGSKQIANYLNNKNIKTKYNKVFNGNRQIKTRKGLTKEVKDIKFSDAVVYSILKNRLYIGERKLNEYEYIGNTDNKGKKRKKDRRLINTFIYKVPAIIDNETFEKVQKQLKDNYNKSGNNTKYENILKDKIKCGICQQNYYMHKRADNSDNVYKCTSIRYNANCGNYAINIDKLNNAVYFYLNSYVKFNNSENLEYIDSLKAKEQNLAITKDNIIKDIELKNTEFENILTFNLADKNFQQIITKKYNEIQEENNKLNADLENTIKEINENKQLIYNLENIRITDVVEDATTFKKYVGQVIDKITIKKYEDDRLKVIFKNKQDRLLHCSIITINQIQHDFILSQRSNIMIMPLMESFYTDDKITPFIKTYIKAEIPKIITI